MTESSGTRQLRDMIREVVLDALPDGNPEGTVQRLMEITESVHENALGYGQLIGEERVLDALIEGRLSKGSQRHWWEATKQKIEAGRQVEKDQT